MTVRREIGQPPSEVHGAKIMSATFVNAAESVRRRCLRRLELGD
jgi:hypothetical protein